MQLNKLDEKMNIWKGKKQHKSTPEEFPKCRKNVSK